GSAQPALTSRRRARLLGPARVVFDDARRERERRDAGDPALEGAAHRAARAEEGEPVVEADVDARHDELRLLVEQRVDAELRAVRREAAGPPDRAALAVRALHGDVL